MQEILQKLRKLVKEEVPEADETISYGIPTYKLNGKYVVYLAAFKDHISIYPVFAEMEKELKEIAEYRTGKGTLQFSLSKPVPFSFIHKVIKCLVEINKERTKQE